MRRIATRLMMVLVVLGLGTLGMGCDEEPEGSCVTRTFSTDFDTYGEHQSCQDHVTAAACSARSGEFDENGDCALFDLFHIAAAN